MSYAMEYPLAIHAERSERAGFIRRTYAHLAGAILAFTAMEFAIFGLVPPEVLDQILVRVFSVPYASLIVVGAFVGFGMLATWWAQSNTSRAIQYAGLGLYVVLEGLIFVPMLWLAAHQVDQTIIPTAGVMTLGIFGGLSMVVFTTRKDFSFLGPIVCMAGFLVLGLVVWAILFQFSLGLWFSFAMVALAGAAILYQTSNVLHHYRTDQHVAASLALFAAIATLFWYILDILMRLRRD